jgi:hypothetical protein
MKWKRDEREITGIGGKGKKRRETQEKRGRGKIFKKKKRMGKRSLVHTSKVWRRVST